MGRNKKLPINKYNDLHNYGIKKFLGTTQNKEIELVYQVKCKTTNKYWCLAPNAF